MTAAVENKTANIRKAVYDFLCEYVSPAVDPGKILWGNQNNIALPKDEDYIIFSLIQNIRHGTGFETWERYAPDQVTYSETVEGVVQIDCYANSHNGTDGMDAMLRAQCIETLARSVVAPAFFNRYGISCLFAEDARNNTLVGDSDLYEARWTVTLHLSYASRIVISEPYFNAVDARIKNVDVSFPPGD